MKEQSKSDIIGRTLFYGHVQTSIGKLMLCFIDESLCYIGLEGLGIDLSSHIRRRWHGVKLQHKPDFDQTLWSNRMERFLNSGIVDFEFTLSGSDFQRRVWHALYEIERGTTCSYSDIATKVNSRGIRAVGSAIGANPLSLIIPCHRVLRSDGSLGGYFWGLDKKRELLQLESCL